jgi:hypothetical protein
MKAFASREAQTLRFTNLLTCYSRRYEKFIDERDVLRMHSTMEAERSILKFRISLEVTHLLNKS